MLSDSFLAGFRVEIKRSCSFKPIIFLFSSIIPFLFVKEMLYWNCTRIITKLILAYYTVILPALNTHKYHKSRPGKRRAWSVKWIIVIWSTGQKRTVFTPLLNSTSLSNSGQLRDLTITYLWANQAQTGQDPTPQGYSPALRLRMLFISDIIGQIVI